MPAREDEYLLWCCISDVPDSCFPVKIDKLSAVGELKKAIKQEKNPELNDIAPDRLTLWMVSIPVQDWQEKQEAIRYPDQIQGSTRLQIATTSLSRIFTGENAPKIEHIHIIAQRPSEPRKRRRFESDESEESGGVPRRLSAEASLPLLDDHDSIKRVVATIKEIRQRVIEEAPHNPTFYADPAHVMSLPFPSHNRIPRRFNMSNDKTFSFMGRERFAEVWETWCKIKGDSLHRQAMYIYGSMGYGKSHILAALVCLLICSGERVVYVPDCGQAFQGSLAYMKMAFLFALCDYPLDLEKIAAWRSLKDIEDFCVALSWNNVTLCFVIDQINALDQQEQGQDDRRKELDDFLHAAAACHIEIYSASANVNSYKYTRQKQTNDLKIILLGGMTQDEMEHWWQRCDNAFSGMDKRRIEDLTGRIPLFLSPFLNQPKGPLRSLEPGIWKDAQLVYVQQEVQRFAGKHLLQDNGVLALYTNLMRCCLGDFAISEPDDLLDRRWFYFSDGHVHCTLGLAREAMMMWLREHAQGDIFLGRDWLQTVEANKDKLPVIGSIVEKMVISKISSNGLRLYNPAGDITLRPANIVMFPDRYPKISAESTSIYVPRAFYCRDVDMFYVGIQGRKADVFAVQITIAYDHADSRERLLEYWHELAQPLGAFDVRLSFVWITESDTRPFERVPAQLAASSRHLPAHDLYWVPISDIDAQLANTLSRVRPRYGASVTIRSRGSPPANALHAAEDSQGGDAVDMRETFDEEMVSIGDSSAVLDGQRVPSAPRPIVKLRRSTRNKLKVL